MSKGNWVRVGGGMPAAVSDSKGSRSSQTQRPKVPGIPALVAGLVALSACVPAPATPEASTRVPGFLILPSPSASATVAVALATTAPLPTPGPSATPVVHTVKAGDTLIGIAVRYGVTVEGIQILNDNVQPEALQPGQQLIIPGQSSAANSGILPSPTPVGLELGPVACYETPVGSRWCFVEARNPGGEPVENVAALVTLAAADGQPMVTDIAYSALNLIPPGGSAPLGVLFAPLPEAPAGAVAQLISAEMNPDAASRYWVPAVSDESVDADEKTVAVSGRVTLAQDAAGPARLVTLVLTLYNERGNISGMRKLALDGELAAGQSLPFEISATVLAGGLSRHLLTIEAQR